MRYAILSDVHANADALKAALVDAHDAGVEKIICLGDVVGYGPDPVAALELTYARVHICLAGNHDDAVSVRRTTDDFNDFAARAVARHRQLLTAEAKSFLARLPYVCAQEGFACAHGCFDAPEAFGYVLDAEDAARSFAARPENLLFVGHTHAPGIFVRDAAGAIHGVAAMDFTVEAGKRYLVNVGSVGYPRSGACRTTYVICDTTRKTVTFRSLPFDLEGYRTKMNGRGLEEAPWLAARAQERREPCVRAAMRFGHRLKVARAAASAADPTAIAARPPERRAVARYAVPLGLLALFGAVLCGFFAYRPAVPGRAHAAARPAAVPPAPAAVPPVPAAASSPRVAEPSSPAVAPQPVAKRATVKIAPDDLRLYFNVRLAKNSPPVKLQLVFRSAAGAVCPSAEEWFTVKRSLRRMTRARAIAIPNGAVTASLEAVAANPGDAVLFEEFTLTTREGTPR